MSIKKSVQNWLVAHRLLTNKDEFLKIKIESRFPPSPIMEVSDRYLKVELDRSVMRNWGLMAGLITFLVLGYGYVSDFHKSWKGSERGTLDFIDTKKEHYGDNYFQTTKKEFPLARYNEIGDDLVLSFDEYLWGVRYHESHWGDKRLNSDIFKISFLILGISILSFIIIRFKRLAPLIFDRERKILYTWRSGKVWVQRFEDLEYQEHLQGMFIPLATVPSKPEKDKKTIPERAVGWPVFRVMPHGNIYVNDMADYRAVLVFITQFMEYGCEHVSPTIKPYSRDRYDFLFFEDIKPEDFDEQLEDLLDRIDHNRPQWLEDVAAREDKII